MSPLADVENLVIEGRYGRADLALRRLEALIPSLAQTADTETLLLALYGRALLSRQRGDACQVAIAACDVLERAAHEREAELWVATACATRARFRVDSGDIGGSAADLARADAEATTGDLTNDTGYRLLDSLALVYAGLRLHDRADEVRGRIENSISERRVLDQAQHWSTWACELAARAMEPLAGGASDPELELMDRAVDIATKLDDVVEADVPNTLRRSARGVRALSAAYRGKPSEALRLLGPDAFGTVADLPLVERQIVSLAAMRAHALVGSLATARSLDDAAAGAVPTTLPNLVLEVCRTRVRLWLETHASGDVVPVLQRMTELLVRLGWRGMDLVADTARQALEHQALRTESRTDALTGVGNRRALDEELRQLLRFGPLPLALILIDIDHFKDVNDVFTHVVGDEVLKRVAASLALQLRTDDQLLRYGGDEFVVLLPGTGDEEADAVAARMAAAVAARPWSELADGLKVTITTGVAAVWSLSGRRPDADAEKLFRRADERLLHGKRTRAEGSSRSRTPAPEPATTAIHTGQIARPAAIPPGLSTGASGALPGSGSAGPVDPFNELAGIPDLSDLADRPHRLDDLDLTGAAAGSTGGHPATGSWTAGTVSRRSTVDDPMDDAFDDEDDDDDAPLRQFPAIRQLPQMPPIPGATPTRSRPSGRGALPPPSPLDRRSIFDLEPGQEPGAGTGTGALTSPRPANRREPFPPPLGSLGALGAKESRFGDTEEPPPIRSRRQARAAARPEADSALETSSGRDAADAESAAREVARAQAEDARRRAALDSRARQDAAVAAENRARAEHEQSRRETELREHSAREQAAREQAAQEQAEREQAARQAAEAERLRLAEAERIRAAERTRREAERLQAERIRAEAERREAERRESQRLEAERIRAEAQRRELQRREAERREAERRETERREAEVRAAERRETERREAQLREAERRETERREAERREAERVRIDNERREAERVRIDNERREAERTRREAERLEEERRMRQRLEAERREAERREAERLEAEAREAERLRQEALVREAALERARIAAAAEAERARASARIREEAYARAAEQARWASASQSGGNGRGGYEDSDLAPAATAQPMQRRAPLYDASRPPLESTTDSQHDRRSHPRPGSGGPKPAGAPRESQPAARGPVNNPAPEENDSEKTSVVRTRREPFGPPTRSQAIIDLSARKRPRTPYKP